MTFINFNRICWFSTTVKHVHGKITLAILVPVKFSFNSTQVFFLLECLREVIYICCTSRRSPTALSEAATKIWPVCSTFTDISNQLLSPILSDIQHQHWDLFFSACESNPNSFNSTHAFKSIIHWTILHLIALNTTTRGWNNKPLNTHVCQTDRRQF